MRPDIILVGRQVVSAVWYGESELAAQIVSELSEQETVELLAWVANNLTGLLRENLALKGVEEEHWDAMFQNINLGFDLLDDDQ